VNKDLVAIFDYLEREKGIQRELVVAALEEALYAAAKKSVTGVQDVTISINPKSGVIDVLAKKTIVTKVQRPTLEISLKDALELNPSAEVGQSMLVAVTPDNFGRIAAQTARQVMTQKLRGLEREVIQSEYRDRIGEIVSGTVKRFVKGQNLLIDLGKVEAFMPMKEYPRNEHYQIGDKVLALLKAVRDNDMGGAEVILSRSSPDFVKALFEQEVPEISDGTVSIEKVAREAGARSKVMVKSIDPRVDAVGSCVGMRGGRIKNVLRELGSEKLDIVPYSDDPVEVVQSALSPVQLLKIAMSDEEPAMLVVVADSDYPIAIGKRGVNARLAGELAGLHLVVERLGDYEAEQSSARLAEAEQIDPSLDETLVVPGFSALLIESLIGAGYDTPRKVLIAAPNELARVPGISLETADRILDALRKMRMEKLGQEPQA